MWHRLRGFVNATLFHAAPSGGGGGEGLQDPTTGAVRASLYYQPEDTQFAGGVSQTDQSALGSYEYLTAGSGWRTWSRARGRDVWRAYNYPWWGTWQLYMLRRSRWLVTSNRFQRRRPSNSV